MHGVASALPVGGIPTTVVLGLGGVEHRRFTRSRLGSLCFSFHPWWTHSEAPSAEGQRVPGFPTAELTGGQVGWMADKQPLSGRWGAAQCLLHGCCYFFFPTLPTDGRQPVPACKLLLPLPRTEQANPESGLQQQHIYTMAGTINKPGSELPAAPAPPAVPPS